MGNWISTRLGSSGIWCRLCTSVSHSSRQGAGLFIQLPVVPALIISSLAFLAAWLVSRTVFGSVRKPLRKRNTGAGNKKLGQRAQKWYEPKRYGWSTECLLAPLGWVLPHLTNEETYRVHSSSRKRWPVLPPWKHAGQEQADKNPSRDRGMEGTSCQLFDSQRRKDSSVHWSPGLSINNAPAGITTQGFDAVRSMLFGHLQRHDTSQ